MVVKTVTLEETANVIEAAVAAEEARQAAADTEPVMTRSYTVHAAHPPQAVALNNGEAQGIVSAINCSGPCTFILRDSGGKVLIHVDAPGGFDSPVALAFRGSLVAELKTHSSITFTLIS